MPRCRARIASRVRGLKSQCESAHAGQVGHIWRAVGVALGFRTATPGPLGRRGDNPMQLTPLYATAAITFFMAVAFAPGAAHTQSVSGGPVDAKIIEDLVAANRILVNEGVLDAFGHVSIRHPGNPNRYLMSRSLAPILVSAD